VGPAAIFSTESMPPEEIRNAPAHSFLRTESIRGNASAKRVAALEKNLRQEGWRGAPISAFEYEGRLYILDGHHRVIAARRAGIGVPYRLVAEDALAQFGYNSSNEVLIAYAEAPPHRLPPAR